MSASEPRLLVFARGLKADFCPLARRYLLGREFLVVPPHEVLHAVADVVQEASRLIHLDMPRDCEMGLGAGSISGGACVFRSFRLSFQQVSSSVRRVPAPSNGGTSLRLYTPLNGRQLPRQPLPNDPCHLRRLLD